MLHKNNNHVQKMKSKQKSIRKFRPKYGFLKSDQKHDKKNASDEKSNILA
jgi:hypothetical protein